MLLPDAKPTDLSFATLTPDGEPGEEIRQQIVAPIGTKPAKHGQQAFCYGRQMRNRTLPLTCGFSVNSIAHLLRNLTAVTRSLRIFAEDLERRPNAIIVGK